MAEPTPAPVRHDDGVHADLFGKPAGMQGRGAAEGNHGAGGDVPAALDGVDAGRIGHVFLDDFGDARPPARNP